MALIMLCYFSHLLSGNKTVSEKLWILGSFLYFCFLACSKIAIALRKNVMKSIPAPIPLLQRVYSSSEGTTCSYRFSFTGFFPPIFAGG